MRDLNKIFERRLQGDCSGLWENREALDKYLKRLKELMEEDENKNLQIQDKLGDEVKYTKYCE